MNFLFLSNLFAWKSVNLSTWYQPSQKLPIWQSGTCQVAKLAVLVVSNFLNAFWVILKGFGGFLHQCQSVVVVLQHQHWCRSVVVSVSQHWKVYALLNKYDSYRNLMNLKLYVTLQFAVCTTLLLHFTWRSYKTKANKNKFHSTFLKVKLSSQKYSFNC